METIVAGTIESLLVTIADRKEVLTDLGPLSPVFSVYDKEDTAMQAAVPCTTDLMDCYCLIDTTVGTWDSGIYRIFITFTSAPETPIKGPFPFKVEEV